MQKWRCLYRTDAEFQSVVRYNRLGAVFTNDSQTDNEYVAHVMKSAQEAGILNGDILLEVNGTDKWRTDPDSIRSIISDGISALG